MENYIFIVNTFLGFIIALALDIMQRERDSKSSPTKFSLSFFWADNKLRLIFTFMLAISLMLAIYFNAKETGLLFGKEWTDINNLIYIMVGSVPDLVVSFAKRRAGFLQPSETKDYQRK